MRPVIRSLIVVIALCTLAACGGGGSGGGGGGDTQTKRLRITNSCSYDIWIQHTNGATGLNEVAKIARGQYLDYDIPAAGSASDRYWPKKGCDDTGQNCTIGQSSDPCPTGGCPPPVDSKLEATWGCTNSDASQCGTTPQGETIGDTYWNMSAVDGFTFPFSASVTGNSVTDENQPCNATNCSSLSLAQCPTEDDLSTGQGGTSYPQFASSNLTVENGDSTAIGCYSPCKYLNYPTFGGRNQNEDSDPTVMYCCPTPPISSAECSAGPVAGTQYVGLIHSACSRTVYAYAYDDSNGLRHCSAATLVHVTFGPNCP